jgi:hypothetical protein
MSARWLSILAAWAHLAIADGEAAPAVVALILVSTSLWARQALDKRVEDAQEAEFYNDRSPSIAPLFSR